MSDQSRNRENCSTGYFEGKASVTEYMILVLHNSAQNDLAMSLISDTTVVNICRDYCRVDFDRQMSMHSTGSRAKILVSALNTRN